MDTMVFGSKEEIQKAYNTGNKEQDLAVVNAVLNGNVAIKSDVPQTQDQPVVPTETPVVDGTVEQQPVVVEEPVVSLDELEQQRKYNEFIEQRRQEEKQSALEEIGRKELELKAERKAREELEERIRRSEEIKRNQASTVVTQEQQEEDEYASAYAKRTRAMLEEIRSQVGDNPKVKELAEEVNAIKSEYEIRKNAELQIQQEKQRKEKLARRCGSLLV